MCQADYSRRCTTKEAGKGELTATGVDPFGKQFECEITEEPDLTYAIAFKPEVMFFVRSYTLVALLFYQG